MTDDRAGFRIRCTEDQLPHPAVDDRAGTHRAGFERDDENAVVETPVPDVRGGVSECEDFGVGNRVVRQFPFVVPCGDDLAAVNDDGTDRHVVMLRSGVCLVERQLHPCSVLGKVLGVVLGVVSGGLLRSGVHRPRV